MRQLQLLTRQYMATQLPEIASPRLVTPFVLAGLLFAGPSLAGAAATSATVVSSETSASLSANADAAPSNSSADSDTTWSIILLGEKVSLNEKNPKKGPFPDLAGATTATLGTDISDFTKQGVTIADTLSDVKKAEGVATPDIVVLFAGFTDEQKNTDESTIRNGIRQIAAVLKKRNPKMRIFLVPSSTKVGTLVTAELRLAAEDAGITYAAIGTEVSGEPYRQAMRGIKAELNPASAGERDDSDHARADSAPAPQSASSLSTAPSRPASPAAAPAAPVLDYQSRERMLQQELNRVAGEVNAEMTPVPTASLTTDSLLQSPASTPADRPTSGTPQEIPPGGTVTKRGKEAQDNINMRPLPALKAYKPQIPVPRNQIEKKEPDLSR